MRNKVIAPLILTVVIVAGFFAFNLNKQDKGQVLTDKMPAQKIIKIAACPTCYELSKNLDLEKYQVIETGSTAQSIALLESGQVDMILAGRTLKPNEPQMDNLLIKDGYSFLSSQGKVVYVEELKNMLIYTDLNVEMIKEIFPIQDIEKVENVYEYLGEGIVVTSWENTDYTKASIVHVLEEDGERARMSRRPTIYCPNTCGQEAQELALYLKQ